MDVIFRKIHGLRVASLLIADAAKYLPIVALLWNSYFGGGGRVKTRAPTQLKQLQSLFQIQIPAQNDTPARSGELTNYQLLYARDLLKGWRVKRPRNPWLGNSC